MYIFLGLVVTTTRNHDGSSLMDQQWLNAIGPITDTAVGPWVNLVMVPYRDGLPFSNRPASSLMI